MNIFQKIKREMKWIGFAIFFKRKVNELDKDRSVTLADELEKQVTKTPKNIAIEFEDQKITYQELEERANKIANWAIQKGYKRGDVVSLLMENRPEYIIFWYGFSKIGATIALLNSNIKGKSLAHCINTSKCKKAIKLANHIIKDQGRLLVRPSGTEPKVRIMCEPSNLSLMKKCVDLVKKTIH